MLFSPIQYVTRKNERWWQRVWPLLNPIPSDRELNTVNSSKSAAEVPVTFVDALSPAPRPGITAVRTNPCLPRAQGCLGVTDRIKHGLD